LIPGANPLKLFTVVITNFRMVRVICTSVVKNLKNDLTIILRGVYFAFFQVENALSTYMPDAMVIVYSVVSVESFHIAEEILQYLWDQYYKTPSKESLLKGMA
jgi:hypothetical protein